MDVFFTTAGKQNRTLSLQETLLAQLLNNKITVQERHNKLLESQMGEAPYP